MNYKDLMSAKELFNSLARLCDTVEECGLWDKPDGTTITLREIFQSDVADFIMYLSASDGSLSADEVQAYRVITGFGGDNAQTMLEYIKDNRIYSMDFESEPPLTMKILSEAERRAVLNGAELSQSVLRNMATFYEILGKIIISIDGGIAYNEKRDFNIILDTIRGFADDHDIVGGKWALLGE